MPHPPLVRSSCVRSSPFVLHKDQDVLMQMRLSDTTPRVSVPAAV